MSAITSPPQPSSSLQSSINAISSIVKKGFLLKASGEGKDVWQKRWFVLTNDGLLTYYVGEKDKSPRGTLNLRGGVVGVGHPKAYWNRSYVMTLSIVGQTKTYALAGENFGEYSEWKDALANQTGEVTPNGGRRPLGVGLAIRIDSPSTPASPSPSSVRTGGGNNGTSSHASTAPNSPANGSDRKGKDRPAVIDTVPLLRRVASSDDVVSSSDDDDDDIPLSPSSESRLQTPQQPSRQVSGNGNGISSGNTSPAPEVTDDDEPLSPGAMDPSSSSTPRLHTKKAQDVLFGGQKNKKNKVFDKLGVSQLEIDRFADQPKAHQKLGIFSDVEFKQNRPITLNTYDDTCIKEGLLWKMGGKVKSWRQRHFVLRRDSLSYWKKKDDAHPAGEIDLKFGADVDLELMETYGQPYCFSVTPITNLGSPKKGRKYAIHASSNEELDSWMDCIRKVVRENVPRAAAIERPSAFNLQGAYTHTRTRAGFLTKKGYVVRNWKKRYFVLSGDSLFYFNSESDATPQGKAAGKQPLGMIPVRDARIAAVDQMFAWSLQPARSQRKFILVASNATDAERWITDLQRASLPPNEVDLEAKMREQEREAQADRDKRAADDREVRDMAERKQRLEQAEKEREEQEKRERVRQQLMNVSIAPPPQSPHHRNPPLYQNSNNNNNSNSNSNNNTPNTAGSKANSPTSPKQGSGLAAGLQRQTSTGAATSPTQQGQPGAQTVASPVHGIASPLSPAGFNHSAASAASSGSSGGNSGNPRLTMLSVGSGQPGAPTGSGGNKTPPPVPPYTPTTMARISMAMSASGIGSTTTMPFTNSAVGRSAAAPITTHSRIDSSASAASSAASVTGISGIGGHGRIESNGQGRFFGTSVYASPSEMKELMRPSGGHSILGAPAKGLHRPQLSTTDNEQITVDPLGDNVKEGYVLRLYPGAWKKVYLVMQRPNTMAQFKSHKLLDGKPDECCTVRASTVEPHSCDSRERFYTFTVHLGGGKKGWTCCADSREELDEWLAALADLGVGRAATHA